ncbi:MAG: tetratricopeptide repeat protein [Candidatus Omnitrophica bacterium]|nr:tetratricopeptide repeat protein [Candidatus Omnitrophota bacterium]MBU4477850.1 tetratricopeptide repeat protein [Candidatus Omnitrophota bacterium]MCG2703476.1 tetratricopeptide repeat protein [Candidatus Omnitrophota bacterium]
MLKKSFKYIILLTILVLLGSIGMLSYADALSNKNEEKAQEEIYAGSQYLRHKEYEEAIKKLKKVIETYPGTSVLVNAWLYLAKAYEGQKQYKFAIEAYRKGLEIKSDQLAVYLALLDFKMG